MRTVLITGVQGAGKSTLGQGSARSLNLKNWDYADLMLQVASDVHHKDELALLPTAQRDSIYRQVDVLLSKWFEPGDGRSECVLLENHLSIVENGQLRTFLHQNYRRYNAVGLVVIEADPVIICERRRADRQRYRHAGSADEITQQQHCNRTEAADIAAYLTIPFTIVNNDDWKEATSRLTGWLGKVIA